MPGGRRARQMILMNLPCSHPTRTVCGAADPNRGRRSRRFSVPAAAAGQRKARDSASFWNMATTVLRVRLIGGDRMDVTYDRPTISDEDELLDHAVSTLAQDSGALRTRHGDRLVVLYGRGVAAIEVAPRGAVL